MSLNDTVRKVEASIPGAKVINAKHFDNPAGVQAAERGTKAFSERVKRTTNEEFGGEKYKPGSVQVPVDWEHPWWVSILVCPDALPVGAKMACNQADFFEERKCAACEKKVYRHLWNTDEDKTIICEECRLDQGFFHEWEVKEAQKWRMKRSSMTLHHLGGMERSNENIGGIMGTHGAPEVAEAMRRAGVLQTRIDQNGNPVETAVFSSRKDMEAKVKMFNRMQQEAADRGFRGTRGGTKFIRHGGITPD